MFDAAALVQNFVLQKEKFTCDVVDRLTQIKGQLSTTSAAKMVTNVLASSGIVNNKQNGSTPSPPSFTIIPATREAHYDKIYRIMCDEFSYHEPITRAVGATPQNVAQFYVDICDASLNGPHSVLALDGDQIAGFVLAYISEIDDSYQPTDEPLTLKANYAEDINAAPYDNLPAKQLIVFIDECERDFKRFLVGGRRYLKLDILYVNPKYVGRGLGTKLVQHVIDTARKNGCDYVVSTATANASAHIFKKLGFKIPREVRFTDFLADGVPVYKNLHDGNQAGRLAVLSLKA